MQGSTTCSAWGDAAQRSFLHSKAFFTTAKPTQLLLRSTLAHQEGTCAACLVLALG
jgi:hypothetical protein